MRRRKSGVRLPLKSYLVYLCLALFLTTGVTFSKYLTSSQGGDTARAAKFGELTLTETVAQELIYTPGVNLKKDPTVAFAPSEVTAYVFVRVDASGWTYANGTYTAGDGALTWQIADGWLPLTDKGDVFYQIVPANHELAHGAVIRDNKITASEELYASRMKDLKDSIGALDFTAYAVQASGFQDAAAAWNAVSGR